jgi:hypothetical protein
LRHAQSTLTGLTSFSLTATTLITPPLKNVS